MPMTLGIYKLSKPGTIQFQLSYGDDRWDNEKCSAPLSVTVHDIQNLAPLTFALNTLPAAFGIRAITQLVEGKDSGYVTCHVAMQRDSIFLKILSSDFLFSVYQSDQHGEIILGEPHAPHRYSHLVSEAGALEAVTIVPLASLADEKAEESDDELFFELAQAGSDSSTRFEIESEEDVSSPVDRTPSPLSGQRFSLFQTSPHNDEEAAGFSEPEYPFFCGTPSPR